MPAHKVLHDVHGGDPIKDPGASGTIQVDRSPAYCGLQSATAETRTLARPLKRGAVVTLAMEVDGGDITLTVTGGINEDGDTTFTFSDPGQNLTLVACATVSSGTSTLFWRKLSDYGLGNVAPADSAVLDELSGLTATVTELNTVADFPATSAITATADGLTTGLIPATAKLAIITSASADNIATLPGIAANTLGIGYTIRGRIAATGCEIRTLASSNETINGVDGDGTQEAALAANHGFIAVVESATGWMLLDGAATVPD
jgi:hypothetical protein